MKKMLVALGIATALAASAGAEEWHFLGTFDAPAEYEYVHDALILDHLRNFWNRYGERRFFNVYYSHNHLSDEGESNEHISWAKFTISGKIVPLDSKTMKEKNQSGIRNAYVVSVVDVRNKGTFRVVPKKLSVYDSATNEILFEASGDMGVESLWGDSAATYILNLSGPHPVWKGALFGIAYNPQASSRVW